MHHHVFSERVSPFGFTCSIQRHTTLILSELLAQTVAVLYYVVCLVKDRLYLFYTPIRCVALLETIRFALPALS